MKYMIIKNNNEIEENALFLMGATDKEYTDKIGFFGSGNKYSISTLLRNNIKFKIFSGLKEIKINTIPITFKNLDYNQIVINDIPTSMTTRLGPDWELWYCIREFVCNAMDEGGYELELKDTYTPEENKTTIAIEINNDLTEIINDLDLYILQTTPIEVVNSYYGRIEIHEPKKEYSVYRKGIRINKDDKLKSLYSYNFHDIDITESRIYKYPYQVNERIATALAKTTNTDIILNYIRNYKSYVEKNARWEYVEDKFSSVWHEVLKSKMIWPEWVADRAGAREDVQTGIVLPNELCEKLHSNFEDLRILGTKSQTQYKIIKADEHIYKIYTKAKTFLSNNGYTINIPIIFVKSYDDGSLLGWYDKEENKIFLVMDRLSEYDLMIETLLEEYYHSRGYSDGSRAMTDLLLKEIINYVKEK